MIKIAKASRLKAEEVIKKAGAYFGPGGYGLKVIEEDTCNAYFEGGGGSVRISAASNKKGSDVNIESVEWDYQAKEFLGSLK
jgi:hypothetical protein